MRFSHNPNCLWIGGLLKLHVVELSQKVETCHNVVRFVWSSQPCLSVTLTH